MFEIKSQLNFDTATTERLSGFIQSLLDALATLLEVASFLDMGKHSEELLNYLRLIVAIEPVHSLYNVQQVFFCSVLKYSYFTLILLCGTSSCSSHCLEPILLLYGETKQAVSNAVAFRV